MLFKSKTSQGDYHGDMNSINFEKWLHQQLLPNLKKPSLIILDNAAYHSRQLDKWPTKTWKKSDIQQWLRSKNISFPEHSTLGVLWDVINKIPKNDKVFAVNKIIEDAGHEVLRLPPYHCQFNATEMVWSQRQKSKIQNLGALLKHFKDRAMIPESSESVYKVMNKNIFKLTFEWVKSR